LEIGNISTNGGGNPAPNNGNSTLNLAINYNSFAIAFETFAFAVFGAAPQDQYNGGSGASQASWTIGPTLNITNTASISLSSAVPNAVAPPLVPFPTAGTLLVVSLGADGYLQGENKTPSNSTVYNGANGGPITIGNSGTLTIGAATLGGGSGAPWQPYGSAITAITAGGIGAGGKTNDNDIGGNGGAGGNIIITTNPGSQINIQGGGGPRATLNGITAYSQGGGSGCDCSGDVGNTHGLSGAGGTVTVNHNNGGIDSNAAYSIGISAVSMGGDGGLNTGHGIGSDPGTSGAGGAVNVTIGGSASIGLTGGGSIGVLAASSVGPSAQSNTANSGGPVTVTLDEGAAISVTGGGAFNIGVAAISTGSPDILQPFATNTVAANGSGFSGTVTVANNGIISTNGQLAIGVAALSIGGSGVFTGVTNSDANALGNLGAYSNGGGAVSVTNGGSIITNGGSAFGILAASNGAGGLINLAQNTETTSDGSVHLSNGNLIGAQTATNNGNGDSVAVSNSGTINTGDGTGGGNLAIGIVAQSIGGGGGSAGGNGIAYLVGDSGGSGGNGGVVQVTNTGGIITEDDGAIGILAQSIGGGGGNGGNAAGIFVATGGSGGNGGFGNSVAVTLGPGGSLTTGGDFAAGIIAQSVGGGGGNGGYGKSVGPFIAAAIGGFGGSAGNGGDVTVTNNQTVKTTGEQSLGILAQSVGGGGGNGGAANAYSIGFGLSVSIAAGGSGGAAGNGQGVTVNNNATLSTVGPDSIGIVAQSIGGGGGNGGAATAKSFAIGLPEIPAFSFSATLGGSGAGGGSAGAVAITSAGNLITVGDGAYGLLAQSIGGGGGNGGDSTAGAYAIEAASQTVKLGVALGAAGGFAGSGNTVSVSNGISSVCSSCVSAISTGGRNAPGLAAQSIGGGGGTSTTGSASTSSPNLGGTTGTAVGINLALGAAGGSGGVASTVTVSNGAASTITTIGSGSQGILAQSIGGGGGNAGGGSSSGSGDNVDVNVTLGGSAGFGSVGGEVIVTNAGAIATGKTVQFDGFTFASGGDAVGILAQSIGGGGGSAGSSDAAASITAAGQVEDAFNTPADSYSANVSVGGQGGAGGSADSVQVGNAGTISTLGIGAYGIAAQAIGGGGGSAGSATAAANSVLGGGSTTTNEAGKVSPVGNTYSAGFTIGGSGGAAGDGGAVTVANTGGILTAGYGAHAIIAQSIGGGGGIGAEGTVNNTTTIGIGAGINGSSGASGSGGTVTISNSSTLLATLGDDAFGILAQSIGGGGGVGSAGCTNSNAAGVQGFSATRCFGNGNEASGNIAPWNDSSDLSFSVGGGAGASGTGGAVSVTENGAIVTTGARSVGIAAQSIGGGGGLSVATAVNLNGAVMQDNPGQNGGAAGNVDVTLASTGSITTSGAGGWGILAQSIGGGGGVVGDLSLSITSIPASNTLPMTGNNQASSGSVSVAAAGNIITTGANAHGIVAQAVGGGGGIAAGCCQSATATLVMGNSAQVYGIGAGSFSGTGGSVTITQTGGTIRTSGVGSIGILAQSSGNSSNTSPINITVGGAVIGGTNSGSTGIGAAGILVSGGASGAASSNTITITGSVSTMDGAAGTAIIAGYGVTNVVNSGNLTGSVDLGSTPGSISNSGTFNTGASAVAGSLTNSGTVNLFGTGRIGATSLSSSFTQTGTGDLVVDINPQTGKADILNIAGSASLAGMVTPVPVVVMPGSAQIISAPGGITGNVTLPSSLLFQWNGFFTGSGGVNTGYSISSSANFTPGSVSLTASQQSLASNFASAWANADPSYATKFTYLSQLNSPSAYAAVLNALSPKATQAQLSAVVNNAGAMLGAAMSCPVFVEQSMLLGEDNCAWAKVTGQWTNQTANGDVQGYNVSGVTYRLGAQHAFAPDWYLGATFGLSQTWASMDGGSTSSGTIYDGSVSLKHTMGPWLFAGSLAIAGGSFHTNRAVSLPGGGGLPPVNATLQSDQSFFLAGGRLRAAYEFAFSNWYLRPYGDLDVIHTNTPGFQESGRTDFALNVQGNSHTSVAFAPMVEFGGKIALGDMILRPYVAAGARFLPDNKRWVDASLFGALPGTGTFRTYTELPSALASVDVGLQLYRAGSFEARAEYSVKGANNYLSQTAAARVAYHF